MKSKLISCVIIFIVCSFVFFVSLGQASEYSSAAEMYLLSGQVAYQTGRIDDAVRDFHSVLMLDAENQEAKDMLEKIVNEGGLYSRSKQATYQIENLGHHMKVYKEMAAVLEQDKARMNQTFNDLLAERKSLAEGVAAKEAQLEALYQKVESFHQEIALPQWPVPAPIVEKLECLDEKELKKQKKAIDRQAKAIAKKQKRLSTLEQSVDQAVLNQKKLMALSKEVSDFREDFSIRSATRDRVFDELEEYVYVRSQALEEVRDRMITNQLDSFYKEKLLMSRLDELIDMNETIDQYRYYLDERDLLLQQRQDSIKSLKQLLADVKK